MESEQKKIKAIEIAIESLKLYVTLSTVSIAGLLAYYSTIESTSGKFFLFGAIVILLLSAMASVAAITRFINKIHRGIVNVRERPLQVMYFSVIALFFLGIIFAIVYIAISHF